MYFESPPPSRHASCVVRLAGGELASLRITSLRIAVVVARYKK